MANPASAGEPGPDRDAARQQAAPAARVGQLSQGESGQREHYGEQREQPAQLRIGKGELVAQRFEDRGQRLAIVEVEDVDQKQDGQCRSNRFGSHWPPTLPHHILISPATTLKV